MVCPTAKILFEDYARAAIELFESADNLANLTGQHERFAEAMRYSKQTHEKCYAARVALDKHRAQMAVVRVLLRSCSQDNLVRICDWRYV
jgi:hypothetical protein